VTTPETSWHVVQTHIHAEAKAQMHLHRQGFETYLPRYLKRRRHARRTETVAAPLYPSYLFVGFSADQRRLAAMLESMAGITDGVRDALTIYTQPLTGAYYFVPVN